MLLEGLHSGVHSLHAVSCALREAVLGGRGSVAAAGDLLLPPMADAHRRQLVAHVEAAGMKVPLLGVYAKALDEPDLLHRLTFGVIGVLDFELTWKQRLPPRARDMCCTLSTEALVLHCNQHGRAQELPLMAVGVGQMPHRHCLESLTPPEVASKYETDTLTAERRAQHWLPRQAPAATGQPAVQGTREGWVPLQAVLTRQSCATLRHFVDHEHWQYAAARRELYQSTLRTAFVALLVMFLYYMDEQDAANAVGSSNCKGCHSHRWWKDTLRRLQLRDAASAGMRVSYGDALPLWVHGKDAAQADAWLQEMARRSASDLCGGGGGDWEDTAARHGWATSRVELVQAAARGKACIFAMLTPGCVAFVDGNGAPWQLATFSFLAGQASMPGASALFCPRVPQATCARPQLPSLPSKLVRQIWTWVWRSAMSQQQQHVMRFPGVESVVLQVLITQSTARGHQGERRGLLVLHQLPLSHGIEVAPQRMRVLVTYGRGEYGHMLSWDRGSASSTIALVQEGALALGASWCSHSSTGASTAPTAATATLPLHTMAHCVSASLCAGEEKGWVVATMLTILPLKLVSTSLPCLLGPMLWPTTRPLLRASRSCSSPTAPLPTPSDREGEGENLEGGVRTRSSARGP
jgi:hypothetical protein